MLFDRNAAMNRPEYIKFSGTGPEHIRQTANFSAGNEDGWNSVGSHRVQDPFE